MADVPKIALGAAVLGGYVLGRTKKGRVAFGMATYLAGRRFGLEPQQLLTEGVKRLRGLPQFADLNEQLRGQALDAGRKALSAVADRKLADLADSLHQRTERIGKGKEEPEEEEPEDEFEEEEEPAEEEPEDEFEEEEEPAE
ncbi:histone protein, partial [Streptomyces sp. NPDC059718]